MTLENITLNKLVGILLIMLGLGLALFILIHATLYAPDDTGIPNTGIDLSQNEGLFPVATSSAGASTITDKPAPKPAPSTSTLPLRLSIPSIGVSAGVQYVGVKSDGSMANPSNFTDVGWYKSGTVPGAIGSAVMAGHVDNALALAGVFKHLGNVKPGDDVYVTRKDGVKLHFVVDSLEYYDYRNAPNRQIFTSSDGKAHLNLVTCAGTWVSSQHSYTQRLVVYTTLVQ